MKRNYINTALWMIICAAVTFSLIPIVFAAVVFSHIMEEDSRLAYVLWPLRLIFIASPVVALFFGLRGALPGTKSLTAPQGRINTTSKILRLVVLVIGGLFTLGAWVAFQPPPGRPNISITFLAYTNEVTGARLARFAITNLNHSTILAYNPNVQIQSPTEPGDAANYWPGYNQWGRLHAKLAEGTSTNFTIMPPTNQLPWRLFFYVYPNQGGGGKNTLKEVVSISCLSVGVWPLFAKFLPLGGAFRLPYNFESDWIKNEN